MKQTVKEKAVRTPGATVRKWWPEHGYVTRKVISQNQDGTVSMEILNGRCAGRVVQVLSHELDVYAQAADLVEVPMETCR